MTSTDGGCSDGCDSIFAGGVIGLSLAMMRARQGHYVTVFERDSGPLPGWPEWHAWVSYEWLELDVSETRPCNAFSSADMRHDIDIYNLALPR